MARVTASQPDGIYYVGVQQYGQEAICCVTDSCRNVLGMHDPPLHADLQCRSGLLASCISTDFCDPLCMCCGWSTRHAASVHTPSLRGLYYENIKQLMEDKPQLSCLVVLALNTAFSAAGRRDEWFMRQRRAPLHERCLTSRISSKYVNPRASFHHATISCSKSKSGLQRIEHGRLVFLRCCHFGYSILASCFTLRAPWV